MLVVVGATLPASGVVGTVVVGRGVVGRGSVVVGSGMVGSGLPSSIGHGAVGAAGGGAVEDAGGVTGGGGVLGGTGGGGVTGAGAVPVCVHKYCLLVPSWVHVSTMLPVFGWVPGTVGGAGSAIVGSGGIVGRGSGLACASWQAVPSRATASAAAATPTARLVRARSAGSCMTGTTCGGRAGSRPNGAIRANGAAGQ